MRLTGLLLVAVGCGGLPAGVVAVDAAVPNETGCVTSPANEPLVVATTAGEVRGTRAGATEGYFGIPYAAPPMGEGRFRAPAPAACWQGVRPATTFGGVCPQVLASGSRVGDEDCLFLNVWTPSAEAGSRPVLFFIHGGGFEVGSGNQDLIFDGTGNLYDGQTIAAENDAVVVTFNYRLGGLGFLAHPLLAAEDPHGSSGNYAVLDQIAALAWVRDNIARFGGDPARVTIFGESAGGLSVCLLLTSPLAHGLFHAAVMESGGCDVATREARFEKGERVARNLGCDDTACLRDRDPYWFVSSGAINGLQLLAGDPAQIWELPDGPNLDGHVFVEEPDAALRGGRQAKVPLIVGSNADEFELFAPPMLTCLDYAAFVGGLFRGEATRVMARYPCLSFSSPRRAAVAVMTDHMFTCEARRVTRAARTTQPVYRYFFTRKLTGHALSTLDAFHASELPFLFGTFDVLGYDASADDRALGAAMRGYWGRLARTGNPNGGGAPQWPEVGADNRALRLDLPLTAITGTRDELCDFWDTFAQP